MAFSWTLFRYLGIQFLGSVTATFLGLLALVSLIEAVELLRNYSGNEDVGFPAIVTMVLFKMPRLAQRIFPFAFLLGAIISFTRLTKNHELVVVRAAGVSVWQFLTPALIVSTILGALVVTVHSPISASMYARFEQLQDSHDQGKNSLLQITRDGVWLRQGDDLNQSVVHALSVQNRGALLRQVIIFIFEDGNEWSERIDAEVANLKNGYWEIQNARRTVRDQPSVSLDIYELPTTLTFEQLQNSFAPPETMSFWDLPQFIQMAEAAGFSALRHRVFWHTILATPVLFCAMVLIAATVSFRLNRFGGVGMLLIIGVLFGFVLFFVTDLGRVLGESGRLPTIIAAWTPAFVALLLGLASLFHLEDG